MKSLNSNSFPIIFEWLRYNFEIRNSNGLFTNLVVICNVTFTTQTTVLLNPCTEMTGSLFYVCGITPITLDRWHTPNYIITNPYINDFYFRIGHSLKMMDDPSKYIARIYFKKWRYLDYKYVKFIPNTLYTVIFIFFL